MKKWYHSELTAAEWEKIRSALLKRNFPCKWEASAEYFIQKRLLNFV